MVSLFIARAFASVYPRVLAAAFVALVSAGFARAATVIDFEDLPPGTIITAQYGTRGVVFQQAYLDGDPAAHSGSRVLRSAPPNAEIFTPAPLHAAFTSSQSRVRMFAGARLVSTSGTLKAFDSNGLVVAEDGPKPVPADVFTTGFEVTLATAVITRVELHLEGTGHVAIDDLEFEGEPPAPPPPQPPVVQITAPADAAELDISTLDIAGTVTGDGLLSPVKLTISFQRPPESAAPPFRSDLSLAGTGTTRQFSLPGFTGVPLGPITITVTAENFGGLKGSASVTFTNLPAAIRDRFIAEGGAAVLGAFQFGFGGNPCMIAVYESAAIAANAGATIMVRADILAKWLSLRSIANSGGLGCPLGEERPAAGGSLAQDFTGGRIYVNVPGGAAYVPAVFVDAIEKRGGEAATGIPLADPTSSAGTMQTWLFQRFTRPERPDLLPSTLEIRGVPPRLWIERQSGDLTVETTGTIYENFECSANLGPCSVGATAPPPPPLENPGGIFCDNTTFIPGLAGPREWEPVVSFNGDYVSTPVFGAVVGSLMADTDLTLTHEWFYDCPPVPLRVPFDCPSDWLVKVKPYGPHSGTQPFNSLFAGTSKTNIKMEYERFYADFVVWMGRPEIGDLMHAAGRWIIDCGHDTYKSELHPIFMFAKMKAIDTVIDPFTGLVQEEVLDGHTATRADIWVNGWYPGDPIAFDIYPPPRPSPNAVLVVNKPVDADAVFGVDLEWSVQPPGAASHVHIRFTAPYRETHVTSAGEMVWEINRGYEGQWYLYWSE